MVQVVQMAAKPLTPALTCPWHACSTFQVGCLESVEWWNTGMTFALTFPSKMV